MKDAIVQLEDGMSGTLEISEVSCWMPPGWIYDNVLDEIASRVATENPELAERIRLGRTDANGGHLDLRRIDVRELRAISNSTDAALEAADIAGPESFADPLFYDGFMRQFRTLQQMLHVELSERGSC